MAGLGRSVSRRLRAGVGRAVPPVRRLLDHRDRLQRELASTKRQLAALQQEFDATTKRRQNVLRDLNTRLEDVQRRNDQLLADTADLVRPAATQDMGYLFIATYGRSGSTVLQAILNTIPGYLIRGENRDALKYLFNFHTTLATESAEHRDTAYSRRSPWWGIDQYAEPAALAGLRDVVVQTLWRPEADTRVIGFKEIRWLHWDWKGYQDFLLAAFPGARFVFNTRNHEDVARSRWWNEEPEAAKKLADYETRLTAMSDRLGPERAFRVHYDDWANEPEKLRPLFDWLGETYDPEAVEAAMTHRYSY